MTPAMPETDSRHLLEQVRAYLLEGFSNVTIAPEADAKTGSALVHVLSGRRRFAVEITDTFLDTGLDRPHPLDAVRKWDLIGALKSAESGSIIRVTRAGLRFV